MSRRKLFIPKEVKVDIQRHLSEKCSIALEGYLSASEEEDALTGDLGATLRINNQKVKVEDKESKSSGEWNWSINYYKFRGRGPRATENKLGADGIFELTLKVGNTVHKKSLLFQSKINWKNDPNLLNEAIKLSTWREAAFILNFTEKEYKAMDIDSVIASKGKWRDTIITQPLAIFIGTTFLDCKIGDVDLRYDAVARKLIWRNSNDQMVSTKFSIPHRISIKISAPDVNSVFKEIPVIEIHQHRMATSDEEILSLDEKRYDARELQRARNKKARIYHTDSHNLSISNLDEVLKRRMQEINAAYENLKRNFDD